MQSTGSIKIRPCFWISFFGNFGSLPWVYCMPAAKLRPHASPTKRPQNMLCFFYKKHSIFSPEGKIVRPDIRFFTWCYNGFFYDFLPPFRGKPLEFAIFFAENQSPLALRPAGWTTRFPHIGRPAFSGHWPAALASASASGPFMAMNRPPHLDQRQAVFAPAPARTRHGTGTGNVRNCSRPDLAGGFLGALLGKLGPGQGPLVQAQSVFPKSTRLPVGSIRVSSKSGLVDFCHDAQEPCHDVRRVHHLALHLGLWLQTADYPQSGGPPVPSGLVMAVRLTFSLWPDQRLVAYLFSKSSWRGGRGDRYMWKHLGANLLFYQSFLSISLHEGFSLREAAACKRLMRAVLSLFVHLRGCCRK